MLPVTSEARTLGDRILAKASSPGRLVRNTLVNFLSSASISINKGKMLYFDVYAQRLGEDVNFD